jgi:hypothetical protein
MRPHRGGAGTVYWVKFRDHSSDEIHGQLLRFPLLLPNRTLSGRRFDRQCLSVTIMDDQVRANPANLSPSPSRCYDAALPLRRDLLMGITAQITGPEMRRC